METKNYTIDASGRTLGRVASEAAKMLMGKTHASYTPNIPSSVKVTVTNVSKMSRREKKQLQTVYTRYTGYPGGFKKETLQNLNNRKGEGEALRRAIERMMPRNRLRVGRMKNLRIDL
jgi:large subunit ribosomal protein L13